MRFLTSGYDKTYVRKKKTAKIINFISKSKKINRIQTEDMEQTRMDALAKEMVDNYYGATKKSFLVILIKGENADKTAAYPINLYQTRIGAVKAKKDLVAKGLEDVGFSNFLIVPLSRIDNWVKEQKEKSDLILTATSYCRTIEEKMENDELVNCSEDEKTEIQSAIGNLREVLSDNNESSTSIKEGFEKLQNLLEGKLN